MLIYAVSRLRANFMLSVEVGPGALTSSEMYLNSFCVLDRNIASMPVELLEVIEFAFLDVLYTSQDIFNWLNCRSEYVKATPYSSYDCYC